MALNIRYAITLLLLIFPIASLSLDDNYFRVELNHVDSKSNFTQIELINRAAARTKHRLSRLTGMQLFSSKNINSTVHASLGEYFMDLAIGTPPLYYSAVVDTGSDLIWTQCTPCKRCVSQPTPIYDPSNSSTSILCNNNTLCSYNETYGTGWTSGTYKEETFTFGKTKSRSVQVPNLLFGCSTASSDDFNGIAGLVGFGRSFPFSLPKQLNTSMFSYCLSSFLDTNSTSTLFIGPMAKFSGTTVKSTPFVKNPSTSPMSSFYYLSLEGISLGTTKLSIKPSKFALEQNGTGGVIIDSGTTITQLVNEAYQAVENAIDPIMELQRVNASETVFDLCYYLPSNSSSLPTMPDLILHFEGADMVLPVNNYMMVASTNQWCLAMSGSDSMSILGNYQQQNIHIVYDIGNEVLSFSQAQCDKL